VAKVFVTCELTIFGLGSHSATGEEWTDNDNAGTSAEAQAFKRAVPASDWGAIFIISMGYGLTCHFGVPNTDQVHPVPLTLQPPFK
jgi:hypothetical protein